MVTENRADLKLRSIPQMPSLHQGERSRAEHRPAEISIIPQRQVNLPPYSYKARQHGPEQRTMVLDSPANCRSFAKLPMAGRAGGTNRSGQRVSDADGQ